MDVVTLGRSGITASRLAVGTGSNGAEQRRRGVAGMARMLQYAVDRGITWWETADMYQTHPHVRAALRAVKRERVVLTSKVLTKDRDGRTKTAAELKADVERFLKELDTDYIDVLLLHCMSDPRWPQTMKGAMQVLAEAKRKGHVRAIGASLHLLAALEAATGAAWGDVFLVRINPFAVNMDVDKPDLIPKVERALEAIHRQGKAIYGMKLLGGTDPHLHKSRIQGDRIDQSLRFALGKRYLSGFTIGLSREKDLDDIIRRIDRIGLRAPKGQAT
jgi:aryl-alcohol dehydrogenase-like predicted oxidoreductase